MSTYLSTQKYNLTIAQCDCNVKEADEPSHMLQKNFFGGTLTLEMKVSCDYEQKFFDEKNENVKKLQKCARPKDICARTKNNLLDF